MSMCSSWSRRSLECNNLLFLLREKDIWQIYNRRLCQQFSSSNSSKSHHRHFFHFDSILIKFHSHPILSSAFFLQYHPHPRFLFSNGILIRGAAVFSTKDGPETEPSRRQIEQQADQKTLQIIKRKDCRTTPTYP